MLTYFGALQWSPAYLSVAGLTGPWRVTRWGCRRWCLDGRRWLSFGSWDSWAHHQGHDSATSRCSIGKTCDHTQGPWSKRRKKQVSTFVSLSCKSSKPFCDSIHLLHFYLPWWKLHCRLSKSAPRWVWWTGRSWPAWRLQKWESLRPGEFKRVLSQRMQWSLVVTIGKV